MDNDLIKSRYRSDDTDDEDIQLSPAAWESPCTPMYTSRGKPIYSRDLLSVHLSRFRRSVNIGPVTVPPRPLIGHSDSSVSSDWWRGLSGGGQWCGDG